MLPHVFVGFSGRVQIADAVFRSTAPQRRFQNGRWFHFTGSIEQNWTESDPVFGEQVRLGFVGRFPGDDGDRFMMSVLLLLLLLLLLMMMI